MGDILGLNEAYKVDCALCIPDDFCFGAEACFSSWGIISFFAAICTVPSAFNLCHTPGASPLAFFLYFTPFISASAPSSEFAGALVDFGALNACGFSFGTNSASCSPCCATAPDTDGTFWTGASGVCAGVMFFTCVCGWAILELTFSQIDSYKVCI